MDGNEKAMMCRIGSIGLGILAIIALGAGSLIGFATLLYSAGMIGFVWPDL